jgi:hypothetical protein
MDLGPLIEKFGLPTAMLILFVTLFITDKIRSGASVDREKKQMLDSFAVERADAQAQVAYRETLRIEERARSDRLEQTLATTTTALRDITEVLKDVEREIVRIEPRNA